MKRANLLMMTMVLAAVLAAGGESFARGGGGGGGGRGAGSGTSGQGGHYGKTSQGTGTQVRPEGSQRRDGSFLATGTTASGATTRPGKGRGVMDGTGVNATAVPSVQ